MRHASDRAGSACAAPERGILVQGEVRSNGVVIGRVGTQRTTQVGLVENDQVIEAFASDGPNQSLDVRILPWAAWSNQSVSDAHGL